MAYAAKRFSQGQLSATLTTVLATVPIGKTWIVTDMELVNTDTTGRTATVRMPGSGAGAEIFNAVAIAANETIQWSGHVVLAAGETITGGASVAAKIALTVSGAEGP